MIKRSNQNLNPPRRGVLVSDRRGLVLLLLSAALLTGKLARAANPTTVAETAESSEREPQPGAPAADSRRGFGNELLSGFVGLNFGARQLHYQARVTNGNLRPYDLPQGALFPVAPGLALSAELFPFVTTLWPVLQNLGLSAHGGYHFVSSRVADLSPKTRWFAYEFNLRARIPLIQARPAPQIALEVGLGRQAFLFSTPGPAQDALPSADYYYYRFGADARLPSGRAALLLGAAYRQLQSRIGPSGARVPAAGQFGEHFPHARISGIELKLGGALTLNSFLEARLTLQYVRYSGDLKPAADATYIAAGAVDQMLNTELGLAACF